jgi:hypothetical protein
MARQQTHQRQRVGPNSSATRAAVGRESTVAQAGGGGPGATRLLGRCFVHPLFDYALIGGGLSLVVAFAVVRYPEHTAALGFTTLAYLILLSNSAHFAASTVRLYAKPGAFETWPRLTMIVPLASLVALGACLLVPASLAHHAFGLYLTWSPYHYAAQAYGLAVLYAYRSGCQLGALDKRLLWWTSLLPFVFVVVSGTGLGLDWLVPAPILGAAPVEATLGTLAWILPWAGIGAVAVLFLKTARGPSGPLPLISVLVLVTNAVWWFVLDPIGAFTWATIFHGIQYLAIASIFHAREQGAREGNRRGMLHHVLWFYGASLLLGYGLFYCLPWGLTAAGFGLIESVALVVVAINIHHFVVDAFIWRMRPGDANRRIAEARRPVAA